MTHTQCPPPGPRDCQSNVVFIPGHDIHDTPRLSEVAPTGEAPGAGAAAGSSGSRSRSRISCLAGPVLPPDGPDHLHGGGGRAALPGAARAGQCSTLGQCTTLHYTRSHCSTVQYSIVQYSAVQYRAVQYSAVQYSTVPCAVQCKCSRVQYSTVHYTRYL